MKFIALLFLFFSSILLKAQVDSFSEARLDLKDSMFVSFLVQDQKEIDRLVGMEFPFFELQTFTGDILSNSFLLGKPTIVHVWDLYCQPCFDQMPLLNQLSKKYKDRLNFIAVTKHPKHEVRRFLAQDKLAFTHLIDAEEFISRVLDYSTIPRTIILDAKNMVREVIGLRQLTNCCGGKEVQTQLKYMESLIENAMVH